MKRVLGGIRGRGKHPSYSEKEYANRDLEGYRGNRNTQPPLDRVAKENYIYALMSSNAYENPYYFDLRRYGWIRLNRYKADNGFSADVYMNEGKKIVVIAFRGTEFFTIKDWPHANLSVFGRNQYTSAMKLLKKMKRRYRGYRFISTGHSLGGGLALHTSVCWQGVDAVTFNTSPRIFKPKKHVGTNRKTVISEDGEILEVIRSFFKSLDSIGKIDYYEYDFLKGCSVREHSMYLLARGLLKVAAISGDKTALGIVDDILG
ncbi:hypothetical protein PM10SUCC1_33360 [Propionigenium maris DSM 9537]|uniref:Lipase (Class 3) n=1 Tax=Propionigenium maris DSM 9537 TaxID=1123000 RepID=A0A9W6GPZ6_9FUSO|nr:Mbeg1-like protein [Propionigenium maris]GLI57822.1 hypothetical protein PM10SUCC1_33360 [Propionigenium maris DSM 9537]